LAFSPDGSYVYFVREDPLKLAGDLNQAPSLGGNPRKVLAGISGPPAFSADGQRVAFVRSTARGENSLLTATPEGAGERLLASYKSPGYIYPFRASWSPDNRILAFARITPQWVLSTIPAEGGPGRPLADAHWTFIEDLTWLPGSRLLVVAGNLQGESGPNPAQELYEVSVEDGETRPITHDLFSYIGVRASSDGKTLLALQDQILTTLQVATPGKESEARRLSAGNQNRDGYWGLTCTPDGKIVYRSVSNGRPDLWETGADGSNPQRITNSGASADPFYPAVSMHGGFITFTRNNRRGQINIWRTDMDGANLKQLTQGENDHYPAITPDGQWVVFSQARHGEDTLMKVASGGGPAVQLTNYASDYPSVSPDSKWIACVYYPGQNQPASLAIVPFEGGQPAKVFPLPANSELPIHWTPDGQAISFINSVNGVGNIWEQPVEGGPPKAVTHFTSDKIFWFDWPRDGRLALSRGTEPNDAVLIKNFQ
jgi:Tol biopolymer transport system component